jgi:hypothetical protein
MTAPSTFLWSAAALLVVTLDATAALPLTGIRPGNAFAHCAGNPVALTGKLDQRHMVPQEVESADEELELPPLNETYGGLLDDLKALGYMADPFDSMWARFYIPESEGSSRYLTAYAGFNVTDIPYSHVAFKMGYVLGMPPAYKLALANYFNLRHGWAQAVVVPNGNLFLWLAQLLTGNGQDDGGLFEDSLAIFVAEVRAFLSDLTQLYGHPTRPTPVGASTASAAATGAYPEPLAEVNATNSTDDFVVGW